MEKISPYFSERSSEPAPREAGPEHAGQSGLGVLGPGGIAQRKLQQMADQSPRHDRLRALQAKAIARSGPDAPLQRKNALPAGLRHGIEALSGQSMADVKVHYNSSRPISYGAHAYAKGNQIHLAGGQERHLPHEAWHIAQQKQGRVRPTTQFNGQAVNDSPSLEREADVMGSRAATVGNQAIAQQKRLD